MPEHPLAAHVLSSAAHLLKDTDQPLHVRFRALFTLKNAGGPDAIAAMSHVLLHDTCPLLKHECAFCLGQMRDPTADPVLQQVLHDVTQHAMVRHEAAEALAAIASPHAADLLRQYVDDPVHAVAQTCQLAVHSLSQENNAEDRCSKTFGSVDPAAAATDTHDVKLLSERLQNQSLSLCDRFSAMFALRNKRSDDATAALADSLVKCSDSALLQHEVAYVLGQLQSPATVPALEAVLQDKACDEMVRHEAAEALGSIGTKEAMRILQQYRDDDKHVVRSSVEVALDIAEYENSDQFLFLPDLVQDAKHATEKKDAVV